jgi:NADH-ubiquinone oxidoreductase chain 5
LPKAIRAPTPVSSLVHSSTLVTAGLFLLMIFFDWDKVGLILIFFTGLFSLFLSSILAVYERDIKKLVALRTLSQIGLCFLSFSLGFYFLCFIHLIRHALFKSLLFLQIGFLIYYQCGQQDIRFFKRLQKVDF